MTVSIEVDTSELDVLALNLAGVGERLPGVVAPVMKRAAQNIKTETQADFRRSGTPGFRAIANKVSYDDINGNQYGWRTTIGLDKGVGKGNPGNLGNIAVFGTYKGGGTRMHPAYWAQQELPTFESELLKAVEGLV